MTYLEAMLPVVAQPWLLSLHEFPAVTDKASKKGTCALAAWGKPNPAEANSSDAGTTRHAS